MALTEIQIKALNILSVDYDNMLTARDFAKKMWPDSPCWMRVKNTGNGATSGKGMWLTAGSYLAKLQKKKLAQRHLSGSTPVWKISSDGERALANCG